MDSRHGGQTGSAVVANGHPRRICLVNECTSTSWRTSRQVPEVIAAGLVPGFIVFLHRGERGTGPVVSEQRLNEIPPIDAAAGIVDIVRRHDAQSRTAESGLGAVG